MPKMRYIEIKSREQILRGMCHDSDVDDADPVVIVHGYFSANRIGPQRLFVKMAEAIASTRFDVYRFDLSGMGESDGDISQTTFFNHVEDVDEIIDFVQNEHAGKKVSIIAHCLGCNIALASILKKPNLFREVIFLAPYYTTESTLSALFTEESIKQLSSESHTYRKGLFAHASYFKESRQSEFVTSLKTLPVMLNVIIPENDQYISLEDNKRVFDHIPMVNAFYLPGADHNFLEASDEVVSCVLRMLKDENYSV